MKYYTGTEKYYTWKEIIYSILNDDCDKQNAIKYIKKQIENNILINICYLEKHTTPIQITKILKDIPELLEYLIWNLTNIIILSHAQSNAIFFFSNLAEDIIKLNQFKRLSPISIDFLMNVYHGELFWLELKKLPRENLMKILKANPELLEKVL